MKNVRLIQKTFLSTLIAITLVGHQAHAVDLCNLMFWKKKDAAVQLVAPPAAQAREAIIEQLKLEKDLVPAFLKNGRTGDVPVILLNADTQGPLKELLDNSMGTMIVQQVGYNNDHGLLRVGQNIMDVDSPGYRGFGEINNTGIAWKPMKSYLDRRKQNQNNMYYMIEVSYLLSPQEMADVKNYQLVRRAAIIRVPFTFNQDNIDRSKPNTLNAGEHCFVFCKGGVIDSHVSEMRNKLQGYGIKDVDQFMASADVKQLIQDSRFKIANVVDHNANTLNWSMIQNIPSAVKIKASFANETAEKQNELINWIVGYDATLAYQKVKRDLEISNDYGFNDLNNKRSAFVLVYGKTTDNQAFKDATFTSPGVMYSWRNDAQKPLE